MAFEGSIIIQSSFFCCFIFYHIFRGFNDFYGGRHFENVAIFVRASPINFYDLILSRDFLQGATFRKLMKIFVRIGFFSGECFLDLIF